MRSEDVETLVAAFEASGCSELHVRFDGFELHLSNDPREPGAPTPEPPTRATATSVDPRSTAPAALTASFAETDLAGFEVVRAPYLGAFYRAPKPGEAPYVEIGSKVEANSDLCLIEVMKLFTAVRAGVGGRIAHILATDGELVVAGQPLFAIAVMAE